MAKKSFEEALAQLQGIVEELETGDLPLEKAIRKFEDGMKLSKYCNDCLDDAESRLTKLTESGEERPFLPSPPSEEESFT
ncbi:exodeoxyribonuclease VII small subunit [Desulfobotulus sp. H1]|uniref:Exodeoxyribonuclease 7 small subunit n=1 Tax=Desulfobotulus pelophilus TaxID=2823377 RepID=A0ABT3NDW1_9BACT|nr:exodeoxyribonuclease VII small subunit [Desulfobotulus pelophilus]MCW7755117.1 exodeoxyribonuclease VII small subunit [Desulfobotulus pelophilus]